ncbi:MAG: ROK family protein [Planctomycetota bacterium]
MSANVRVGVDIGGTSVKLGAIDAAGAILGERTIEIPAELREAGARATDASVAALFDAIVEAAVALGATDCLGVGVPGLLDRAHGGVVTSPNLRYLEGRSIVDEFQRRLGGGTVILENDANLAALGEVRVGGARGARNALVVTLGTGVGGGLILNGELFIGEGAAGEIGHVVVDPDDDEPATGLRGSIENRASATAAMRRARAAGMTDDLEALSELARRAPGRERTLLEAIGEDLGHGLGAARMLLDLDTFVFGGGFANALDLLEPGIRRGMAARDFGTRAGELRILAAELGNRAGWIGAACLCQCPASSSGPIATSSPATPPR